MEKLVLNSDTFLILNNNKIAGIVRTDNPAIWRATNPYTGEENEIDYEQASNYYKDLVDVSRVRFKTPSGEVKFLTEEQLQAAIDALLFGIDTGAPQNLIDRLQELEQEAIAPGGKELLSKEELAQMQQEQKIKQKAKSKKFQDAGGTSIEQFMHPSEEIPEIEKQREDAQQDRIRHKIFLRMQDLIPGFIKSIDKYEKQKNVKLTATQLRIALKNMLNKNEIGLTGSDEVKENLLDEAWRLLEAERAKRLSARKQLKTLVDDLVVSIRQYEQKKDIKISPDQTQEALKRTLEESSVAAEFSEKEREELFNMALNYLKSKLDLSAERLAGVFTIEELIKLGASEKLAMGLVEMAPGEQKQVLDETSGESVNIEKTVTPNTGEELYIVEDTEGKKAVKPEDPKIQELNQSGLVVEAFTNEQKTILTKLGFTP